MRNRLWMAAAAVLALAACDGVTDARPGGKTARAPGEVRLDSGWVLRDGAPMRVVYEVRHGRALFEGDIDLGPAGRVARTREALLAPPAGGDGPRRGVVTSSSSQRWANGFVPYVVESNVGTPSRITSALSAIAGNAHGIQFVQRTTESSWMIFRRTTDPDLCGWSPIGRQGGGQVVLIHNDCNVGAVIHEVLHSLGFWHEQSRCDRDLYVQILTANIQSGYSDQFTKRCTGATDVHDYDIGSIMHYDSTAFGRVVNGVRLPTIRYLGGATSLMGQRDSLSPRDVHTLDWMYQPAAATGFLSVNLGYKPYLGWNAYDSAEEYAVELVVQYEEYDYERGYTTFENVDRLVGTTTNQYMTDSVATYTGNQYCDVYYSSYGQAYYVYWYQLVATLPNGIVTRPARIPAYISTC